MPLKIPKYFNLQSENNTHPSQIVTFPRENATRGDTSTCANIKRAGEEGAKQKFFIKVYWDLGRQEVYNRKKERVSHPNLFPRNAFIFQ